MKVFSGMLWFSGLLFMFSPVSAQSGLDDLNANDIYSIRIIQQSNTGITDEKNITRDEDIKEIVDIIKKYDYRDFGIEDIGDTYNQSTNWRYRIVFEWWSDEIYLFDEKIHIGKSAFRLPPGMIREFDRFFC